MYRAVFFDLGGTLFSYRNMGRGGAEALMESARRLGVDAAPKDIGRAYRDANRSVSKRYGQIDYYLHRDLFRDVFAEFAEALAVPFLEEVFDWYAERQREAVLDHLELREDCLETLAALRDRGLYLSIVSNIDDDHLEPLVAQSGLHDYLDHWTSSEQARSCKPHQLFFEVAREKAAVEAHEVLFVGDSPEHDIHGAKNAGMSAVLIEEEGIKPPLQSGRTSAAKPDFIINQLAELVELNELEGLLR
jgi:putative hydrolase of the HAD superfamily